MWSETDRDAGVWTVPASRVKTAREHRVPLCGRAVEILDAARKVGRRREFDRVRQRAWDNRWAASGCGFLEEDTEPPVVDEASKRAGFHPTHTPREPEIVDPGRSYGP